MRSRADRDYQGGRIHRQLAEPEREHPGRSHRDVAAGHHPGLDDHISRHADPGLHGQRTRDGAPDEGNRAEPEHQRPVSGRFLDVEGFSNIVVENNYLQNTSGIYLYKYQGNHTASNTVKVRYNVCLNVDGRVSNGKGGWRHGPPNPDYYRQFFQINGVRNVVGAEVAWNQIVNIRGQSRVKRTSTSTTRWGPKAAPSRSTTTTSRARMPPTLGSEDVHRGGVMTSDNGSSYIHVYSNQIVATGTSGSRSLRARQQVLRQPNHLRRAPARRQDR